MFMYTDYTQHLLDNVKKIHFIGCGGSGMYPLMSSVQTWWSTLPPSQRTMWS